MRAFEVASVYFGSFLAIGLSARFAMRRWMDRGGLDLRHVQAQLEPRRGKRRLFLLGAWRDESSN
jgi:hypothetical protein